MDEKEQLVPKPNCKKCWGKGYIKYVFMDEKNNRTIPCPCLRPSKKQ